MCQIVLFKRTTLQLRTKRAGLGTLVCVMAALAGPLQIPAQIVLDQAVQVSAVVQTNQPQIALSWPAGATALSYNVYRKSRDATSWGSVVATLGASATNYTDTSVVTGTGYEYRISKTDSDTSVVGEGYIYCGIQMPLVESRGKVVLIVDNTYASSLAMELQRLQSDLTGDGWTVIRHDVARTDTVTSVKALIQTDYLADPANVNTVFLFGHVPVPYAGDIYPDEHPDHEGAWPCDGYYGDMTGAWLDTSVNVTVAADSRNWNVPNDGKFDPLSPNDYWFPATITLQVGRVDLSNLPDFALPEGELLRQYLNKDHSFRQKLMTALPRGLIDDNFGWGEGEAFAVSGWRNFAAFFDASNTFTTSTWVATLSNQSYLWGYGCGPANYNYSEGVTSTAELATSDPQVVFTMLYGSYFGDWDVQNDLLRAPLATPTYTLTCAWSGRPLWQFHHMALGETTGFSTRLAQNNNYSNPLYATTYAQFLHIALMGDPALRMHVVAPPSSLLVSSNGSGGVNLSWNASPDAVLGYDVYDAPAAGGPFTRLNTDLLTGLNYTDPAVSTNVYMVRAVTLEVSASGSYSNASLGIFQSLDGTAGAPSVNLFQPTNTTAFGAWPAIQICADTFDPANCITDMAFYANGAIIGQTNAPPYRLLWSNVPGGTYALTARALCSSGWATNSRAVTVQVANGTVGTENTTTSLSRTTGSGTQTYGSALTFTVTVTGNATTPGGSVIIKDGSTTLATVWLVAGMPPSATATYTSQTGPQCDWIAALHCRLLSGRQHA